MNNNELISKFKALKNLGVPIKCEGHVLGLGDFRKLGNATPNWKFVFNFNKNDKNLNGDYLKFNYCPICGEELDL